MKTLYFKCELKTDVIISESAATSGEHKTLDFIPGSNFLGICAKTLYKDGDEAMLTIFHTGDVQFGDAHPINNGMRSLKIPASMYFPKLKKVEEECYINHGHEQKEGEDQLKQCRNGFYGFDKSVKEISKATVSTSFAIKSAYDYEKRRSEDEKMYGYQSIDAGTEFLFEVRLSNNAIQYEESVKKALLGEQFLGRSKTAQYGLVSIAEANLEQFPSYQRESSVDKDGNPIHVVYADSRLIFIDNDTLQPKFRITAEDLGFKDGKIKWELSQVRTFQYAPWNNKRQNRDADRCGIEKGSVIVVEGATKLPECNVVGNFRSEGFGKVIFNPSFMEFDDNGLAIWKFVLNNDENKQIEEIDALDTSNNPLLTYLKESKKKVESQKKILEIVNLFVEKHSILFKGEQFAAQWGKIRSIVTLNPTYEDIMLELFEKKRTIHRAASASKPERDEIKPDAYLTHGVAAEKWKKRGRKDAFKTFISDIETKIGKNYVQKAIINLASELQKANK